MNRTFLIAGLILVLLNGCSSDSVLPLPEEPDEPVVAGIYEDENRWVYGQMNHYYLWRKDMPDSLSCDYTVDPVTFYKALLSPEDRFSYSIRNTDYTGNIECADYGFAYQKYKTLGNEELLQVLYVSSGTLKKQGLRRGDWLKFLKPERFIHGGMKGGIFEPFDTLDIKKLHSRTSSQTTVYLDSIYQIKDKKIGYLCYLEFEKVSDLQKTFEKFYNNQIDELILDLRYNPGGLVNTCRYLCNSIVSEEGYEKIFQQCTYNDRLSEEYKRRTGSSITMEYYDVPDMDGGQVLGTRLYGLNLKRVYVLTSENTASASEATIICLRPYMDVVVIGEKTYGKGVGSVTIADSKYKYMLQPIIMRYYNADMETTPDDGIPVDIEIAGGYQTVKKELGDMNEPLLAAALKHIVGEVIDGDGVLSRSDDFALIPIGVPSFFEMKNEY